MAKKKTAKKAATSKQAAEQVQGGKVRLELRFEEQVLAGIKALAEGADISVNQLMHGLAAWAVQHGKAAVELLEEKDGFVIERRQPGCVSMGYPGRRYDKWERQQIAEDADVPESSVGDYNGKKFCVLDFTVRRVVRED